MMTAFVETLKNKPRARFWLVALGLLLAILASYSNSFTIGFQFDDLHVVQSNMYIRSLTNIPQFFTDAKTYSYRPENSGYRPMTTTILAVGFALSGLEPWGYHLIKLIEHALVAILIFWFGLRFLPRGGRSAPYRSVVAGFAALLFAVHRANTETVNYISAVSTLQAALFFLIGFWAYLRARDSSWGCFRRTGLAWYLISVLSFFASIMSKEEGITLPAMILIYEWIYSREQGQSYWSVLRASWLTWIKRFLPYAMVALVYLVLRTSKQDPIADASRGEVETFSYFITQIRAWFFYWKLYFFPFDLNADNMSFDFSKDLGDWRVWVAGFFHLGVWAAAYRIGKRFRFVWFAVLWMYVTILPASSIFRLVEAVNEHRMYIPYVGLSLLVAWSVFEIGLARFSLRSLVIFLALTSIALGAGTFARNKVWQTQLVLWEDVLEKNPESVRAMNVLGVSYMNDRQTDRSRALLERCLSVSPSYLPCMVHLSMVYAQLHEYDKGLAVLQRGYKLNPKYPHLNYHLGVYYKEYFGNIAAARDHFKLVVDATSGRMFQATLRLAEIAMIEGRVGEGMTLAKSVLSLDQVNGDAWDVLARGAVLSGDLNSSIPVFERLVAVSAKSPRPYILLGSVYERRHEEGKALEWYQKAVAVEPMAVQGWAGIERVSRELKNDQLRESARAKISELKTSGRWNFIPSLFLPGESMLQVRPQ